MTRFVIGPDVGLQLSQQGAAIPEKRELLAPTLFRSQTLSLFYQAVRRGQMTRSEAEQRLGYLRGLRIRFLGDRVLQSVAWKVAEQLGLDHTLDSEYIALTQLQADAFVTLDPELAAAAQGLVHVAPIEALTM